METKENLPRDLKVTPKQGLHDWLPKLEETLAAVYLSWAGEYFEGDKPYYIINEICNI